MRFFASSADAWPSTDNAPESGKRIDMIIRIVVVLPAPFGPMNPYSAPRGIARSRSATAFVAPKLLHTFCSRMASDIAVESNPPGRFGGAQCSGHWLDFVPARRRGLRYTP